MRALVVTTAILALTSRAPADTIVPAKCRTFLAAPAPTLSLALAHRVSVATCMASVRLDAAQRNLDHTTEVIQSLGDAVAPSITMLDEVIQAGDPALAIIAERAKGDLYVSLGIRLRNLAAAGTETEAAVRPWLEAGDRAFAHAQQIAESNPELTEDPVVISALRISTAVRADTRAIIGAR